MNLMIDYRASTCIMNNLADFVGKARHINRRIKGIVGHAQATHKGTVQWKIEDNTGRVHLIHIKDTYYMTDMPNQILSPQHFAQVENDHHPSLEGMGLITHSKNITLFWGQSKYAKTTPLDKNLNIGLTWTAPGDKEFAAYMAMMNHRVDQIQAFVSHIITDDEDAEDNASMHPRDLVQAPDTNKEESPVDAGTTIQGDKGAMTTFGMQDLAELHVIPNDEQPTTLSAQDELIQLHHQLGHLPYDCI